MGRKFGFSFSGKRASGISGLKGKIARATGIPTTSSGMYRKIGRSLTGGAFSTGSEGSGGRSKAGRKTFGTSFSINRALGISGAKTSLARAIGVPTTAAGLERKIGKMVVDGITGGGSANVLSRNRQSTGNTTTSTAHQSAGRITPVPVFTDVNCSLCGLPLFPEELLCPRCAALAPGIDQHEQPRIVWVDVDALHPIELAILQSLTESLTDTQLLKRLTDMALPFEEHPVVAQVRHWADLTCNHSTHNTDKKREKCLDKQAAKIALPTLRHYMAMLGQLISSANPMLPLRYAVWLCDDTTENCPLCKLREGTILPVTTRRLPIIDPFCDCNIYIMAPGQEDVFLAQVVRKLQQFDSDRALLFQKNAYRSGFLRKPVESPATCGSCCLLPMLSILLFIIIVFSCFLMR